MRGDHACVYKKWEKSVRGEETGTSTENSICVGSRKESFGGRSRQISEFKASMVYRASSRSTRATQRNPVSNNSRDLFAK